MQKRSLIMGWAPLMGVPALFFAAYFLGQSPKIIEIPVCAVKMFLGIDCPGCGLTHSFASLTHGSLLESIRYHPMGIIISIWLIYNFFRSLMFILIGKPLPRLVSESTNRFLLNVFIFALMFQWVAGLFIKIYLKQSIL